MNSINKDSEPCSLTPSKKIGSRRCSVCDKEFQNEKSYFGHLRIHSNQGNSSCNGCTGSRNFIEPISQLKSDEISWFSLTKPFKCAVCENVFDRASQLDYHRRSVHLGEKSQICQICGKGFFRKNDLQTHLNVHLGTNQLICEICGRKFNHVSNLIRHCRTHAGSKPYPCTICGKRFTQISSLSRHKNIHGRKLSEEKQKKKTGIILTCGASMEERKIMKRQHYCCVCGETFEFMILLRQHKRIHAKIPEKMSIENFCNRQDEKLIYHDNTVENSMENFMELDKMNSIEVERDVSILDILSPYNCNDIELSNEENLEDKLYGNNSSGREVEKHYDIAQCLEHSDLSSSHVSQLVDSMNQKSRAQIDKCGEKSNGIESDRIYQAKVTPKMKIPSNKVYTEVEGIPSVDLQEIRFQMTSERDHEGNINVQGAGKTAMLSKYLNMSRTETETEDKHFYELIINNKCNAFESVSTEKNKEEFFSEIDQNDSGHLGNGNTRFGTTSEFHEYSPNVETFREMEKSPDPENTPMVRLVQNEDGEQFFELVREPLEYEKNRGIDRNTETLSVSGLIEENTRNSRAPNATNSNSGNRKEKKEIFIENGPKVVKDRTRKFKCNECDKWFSTAYNFKQHAGTHFFDQQKYRCEYCGVSFAWKSTLNKHLAGNHRPDGPQKFVCEICPKVYSTLSQVNEHVKRDHLKERNHVCTLCGKSFFKKFDLKTHSRIHTKERPYICRACGKGFHHQSHIIRHERIHSGERPYECQICQKTFTQPSSLKSHRQRHREVRIDILEYRMDEDDPLTSAVQ
ncbi:zinc finger protein 600-like [Venturia canescens]|uniref:zinc finger protein 600-like n=1 Tax=Venturia canescens TaxID=32260 RepID=UPI001C9C837A|nr:zinc finger protein 600-like [Venturia canescens]XP_043266497.1 zinc finger protein 600-like [Venturia canescens]XP_043289411.1 zinc finger protein 600-like [Venturia canescens]XP_043289493.1 zinc finger protein 600-like [Venturia canescens]XP_043289581.1 zinc finger protein 600-like [Venturia canescens]XP_043289661.1 zinc finger protein 600-like [Venturia canescens]XP_043289739.1 zinc finger protein 600-like [Venturia canescens]XP_043289823.1 zinc finger protein 600-like [Venturia canesc